MSLIKRYVGLLLKMAQSRRGTPSRVLALASGAVLFLVALAWLLMAASIWLAALLLFTTPGWCDLAAGSFGLTSGAFFLIWSVWSQWVIGGGTPNPAAPTRRLMIRGAYRYCRNPLQLGAMLYYLGVGALFCNAVVGAIMLLLAFALGAPYHRFVEEKELVARFGSDYEQYRRKTPFMIPRWHF